MIPSSSNFDSPSAAELRAAFRAASPRLTPRPTPPLALAIYAVVIAAWALLFARALWLDNIWAWSAGIAYILYDTVLMALVAWQTLPLRRALPDIVPAAGPLPRIAIVIAAYNETRALPATIEAIFAQGLQPAEILIADDGSTDDTGAMLTARYCDTPQVRWLGLPRGGKAQALNAALLATDAEIVITLDADTLLMEGALAAVADAFARDAALVAAGGVIVPFCGATPTGRVMQFFQTYEYIRNMISRFAWMRGNSLLLISGAFAAFRRDALLATGGFDGKSLVEDYEVTHRLHRYSADRGLGWRLQMIGGAMARTEAPSQLLPFLRQRRRWFAGFLQTQYWNRDMTGNARYGLLGTRMLPIKAIDTLQPIYGLTAFVLLLALVAAGQGGVALSVGGLIAAKIVADFAAFMWSIHLYRQITRGRTDVTFGAALVAAVLEPFSFQLLRHAGAAWGWIAFLTGTMEWGRPTRAVSAGDTDAT